MAIPERNLPKTAYKTWIMRIYTFKGTGVRSAEIILIFIGIVGRRRSFGSLIVAVLTFLEKRKVSTKIVHPVASRMGSLWIRGKPLWEDSTFGVGLQERHLFPQVSFFIVIIASNQKGVNRENHLGLRRKKMNCYIALRTGEEAGGRWHGCQI